MPFSGQNGKRKENNSEKIREIKQRQQNWLVQREQSKSKESNISKPKSVPVQKSTSIGSSSNSSTYQPTIQSYKHSSGDQGKKRVTDTFNHWKKTRESSLPYEDIDTISIESDAESELERLVSPDIDFAKHPIAEEEFGTLADKIASRVKQNMGMSESYVARNTKVDDAYAVGTLSDLSSLETSRCKSLLQSESMDSGNGNSSLASHHCSACQQLMSSSEHIPLMIIPCGHTMCKACSDGKTECPECNCTVVSLTVNIMLQQVIQEYHSHNVQAGASITTIQKSPQVSSSGITSTSTSSYTDTRRTNTASYQSQLHNLHTRQNILSDEHGDLVGKVTNLNRQILHTSQQTKSIANQEHEVKKAIVDLQDKLMDLETHRKQYESQLSELYDVKSEMEGKITLLSGTLASLSREVEKVKLLAEGEESLE